MGEMKLKGKDPCGRLKSADIVCLTPPSGTVAWDTALVPSL